MNNINDKKNLKTKQFKQSYNHSVRISNSMLVRIAKVNNIFLKRPKQMTVGGHRKINSHKHN